MLRQQYHSPHSFSARAKGKWLKRSTNVIRFSCSCNFSFHRFVLVWYQSDCVCSWTLCATNVRFHQLAGCLRFHALYGETVCDTAPFWWWYEILWAVLVACRRMNKNRLKLRACNSAHHFWCLLPSWHKQDTWCSLVVGFWCILPQAWPVSNRLPPLLGAFFSCSFQHQELGSNQKPPDLQDDQSHTRIDLAPSACHSFDSRPYRFVL